MPKVVDHEERRRELAEAVWRVMLRGGVEGVSVREVAAEAGWSAGALRHYLGTKDELLTSAARLLEERVVERYARRREDELSPREAVRAMLCVILPLDEERRVEGRIWLAFANRSLVDENFSIRFREILFDGIGRMCVRIIDDMAALELLAPDRNPEVEARRLHALIDGLAIHGLYGRLGEEEIVVLLDTHLDEIFL